MSEAPAIRLQQVSQVYRRTKRHLLAAAPTVTALDDVSLAIPAGARYGVVGESGSGKSTLLRLIAGLESPSAGRVEVLGQEISGRRERDLRFLRESVQMVFQDPMGSLDPRMRVRDSVAEPLVAAAGRAAGAFAGSVTARVDEVLTQVGLDPSAGARYPHQFSGGQRQRISIARALAASPRILLADEPVSALDVSVRAQVLNLLHDLTDDLGLTLVFVSHDLSVVRHLCEQVAVLHHGRLVEAGPVEQVWQAPQQEYTARLIASVPTLAEALAGRTAADLASAKPMQAAGEGPWRAGLSGEAHEAGHRQLSRLMSKEPSAPSRQAGISTAYGRRRRTLSPSTASAAQWLDLDDAGWPETVTFGPAGFAAYARVRFIPDPQHTGMSEADVEVPDDHPSDLAQMVAAVDVLARWTTTPQECFVGVWDGWFSDRPAWARGAACIGGAARSFYLLEGPLSGLHHWGELVGEVEVPALVWPRDHAWCLARDVDSHWAGVGASEGAIQALLAEPGLDVVRADRSIDQPGYG